jgi:c-di-GMP-binding flagellar brake protein YcgR
MEQNKNPDRVERRKYPRKKIIMGVDYSVLATPQGTGVIKNISEGGVCILIDKFLASGTILKLKYYTQKKGEEVLVETVGKVCWCRQGDQGYLVGVQFVA